MYLKHSFGIDKPTTPHLITMQSHESHRENVSMRRARNDPPIFTFLSTDKHNRPRALVQPIDIIYPIILITLRSFSLSPHHSRHVDNSDRLHNRPFRNQNRWSYFVYSPFVSAYRLIKPSD